MFGFDRGFLEALLDRRFLETLKDPRLRKKNLRGLEVARMFFLIFIVVILGILSWFSFSATSGGFSEQSIANILFPLLVALVILHRLDIEIKMIRMYEVIESQNKSNNRT